MGRCFVPVRFILSTASLRVDEDAIVWSLDRRAFGELMTNYPNLALAPLQNVVRLQAEGLAFATRWIAAIHALQM